MIIFLDHKAGAQEIKKASAEFGSYIKIVVDISKQVLAMGGKLHADAEKILIENGSRQEDLWGGGFDLKTKSIDSQAIINIRPNQKNDNMEILSPKIRNKFLQIARKLLI